MVSFITRQQCVKVLHSCFRQVTHVKRVDSKVMKSQRSKVKEVLLECKTRQTIMESS